MAVDEKRMKEVDGAYGPAEDMAPFLPYHSTEEASFISGAVFTVTGNGRVMLYSDPEPTAEKDGAPWSVDELIETVPLPCSRTWSPRRRATMGMISLSGATGQISTPPFVELHQRPGARRGQPLGRPPPHVSATGGGRVRPAGWPYRGTRRGGTRGRGRPGRRVLQSRLRGTGSRAASANARTHRRTRQGRRPAAVSSG